MKNMGVVYKHIFPNGKVYIGQTKFLDYERRWAGGYGYINQPLFKEIKKYGWDNIKHEILFNNGIESNELRIESYYIKLYKSDNLEYGYNYPHLQQKEKTKKCKCIELDKEFESLSSASNFLFGHKYSGSLISTSCKNNTEVCGYHFVFI